MTDHYVATAGNDANAGTQASPIKTIGALLSRMAGSDRGFLRGGDAFAEQLMVGGANGLKSGAASSPTTIDKYGTGRPALTKQTGWLIDIVSQSTVVSHLRFHGLDLKPGDDTNNGGAYLVASTACAHWLFDNLNVNIDNGSNNPQRGLHINGGSYFTVRGSRLARAKNGVLQIGGRQEASLKGHHHVFEDCEAFDGNGDNIVDHVGSNNLHGSGGFHRWSRNVAYDAGNEDNFDVSDETDGDMLIEFCHGYNSGQANMLFKQVRGKSTARYNLLDNAGANGNLRFSADIEMHAYCNILKGAAQSLLFRGESGFATIGNGNIYLTHNIITGCSAECLFFDASTTDAMFRSGAKVYVENNLLAPAASGRFMSFAGALEPTSSKIGRWNGNWYFGAASSGWDGRTFSAWKALGHDATSGSGVDPRFAAATSNNYTPTASAYDGAGIAGVSDPGFEGLAIRPPFTDHANTTHDRTPGAFAYAPTDGGGEPPPPPPDPDPDPEEPPPETGEPPPGPEVPPYTFVGDFQDRFAEDVDIPLPQHPPDKDPIGTGWIAASTEQTFTVIAATGTVRASGNGAAVRVDLGGPDQELSARFDPKGADNVFALQLRRNSSAQGADTCYQAILRRDSTRIELVRRVNGVGSALVTLSLDIEPRQAHRLRGRAVTLDANTVNLRVWLDDGLNPVIDANDTSAQRLTAGNFAAVVHYGFENGGGEFDDVDGYRLVPVSGSEPAVNAVSAASVFDGLQLTIDGVNFGSAQGLGTVELATTADAGVSGLAPIASQPLGAAPANTVSGGGLVVPQTVLDWTSSRITVSVARGALALGTVYLFVTRASGERTAHGYALNFITAPVPIATPAAFAGPGDAPIVFDLRPYAQGAGGAALLFVPVTGPDLGELAIRADGTGVYAPPAGFTGQVSGATYRTENAGGGQSVPAALSFVLYRASALAAVGAINLQDARLEWAGQRADLALELTDLAAEQGLRTAVIVSLFSDARARDDDRMPDGSADRRGFWGDVYARLDGDELGSRLWLLEREKQAPAVLAQAREYAEDALRWLLDERIASAVSVAAERLPDDTLGLVVRIERPGGGAIELRFDNLWQVETDRGI